MFSPQGSPGPTLPAQVPAPSQKGEKFAPNWFEQRRAVTCQCPRWLWPGASHRWSKGWENQHPAALHPQVGCCCQPQEGTQIQGELFGFLWVFFFPLALAHRAAVFPDTFPPRTQVPRREGSFTFPPTPCCQQQVYSPPLSVGTPNRGGGGGHTEPSPSACSSALDGGSRGVRRQPGWGGGGFLRLQSLHMAKQHPTLPQFTPACTPRHDAFPRHQWGLRPGGVAGQRQHRPQTRMARMERNQGKWRASWTDRPGQTDGAAVPALLPPCTGASCSPLQWDSPAATHLGEEGAARLYLKGEPLTQGGRAGRGAAWAALGCSSPLSQQRGVGPGAATALPCLPAPVHAGPGAAPLPRSSMDTHTHTHPIAPGSEQGHRHAEVRSLS